MKAHELLQFENNWCDDAFAKDTHGKSVWWHDPSAVQFDLQGAIHRCYPERDDLRTVYSQIFRSDEFKFGKGLVYMNSLLGWEGVYNLLVRLDI